MQFRHSGRKVSRKVGNRADVLVFRAVAGTVLDLLMRFAKAMRFVDLMNLDRGHCPDPRQKQNDSAVSHRSLVLEIHNHILHLQLPNVRCGIESELHVSLRMPNSGAGACRFG